VAASPPDERVQARPRCPDRIQRGVQRLRNGVQDERGEALRQCARLSELPFASSRFRLVQAPLGFGWDPHPRRICTAPSTTYSLSSHRSDQRQCLWLGTVTSAPNLVMRGARWSACLRGSREARPQVVGAARRHADERSSASQAGRSGWHRSRRWRKRFCCCRQPCLVSSRWSSARCLQLRRGGEGLQTSP
jgi:hypothetical protein